jgi:GntR family transcriptional regulator
MTPAPERRLPLTLDPRLHQPVYIQLMQQIRQHARSGRLRPGDRLPTVRALAARLGVNFNTVARAYYRLGRAGLLAAQPGRGTFMLNAPRRKSLRALQALAEEYLAHARALHFDDEQIAATLRAQLHRAPLPPATGDNHE